MADTIAFRPDEDTSRALEVLAKDGTAASAAVRSAIVDAARRKAGAAIRAEAERLAAIFGFAVFLPLRSARGRWQVGDIRWLAVWAPGTAIGRGAPTGGFAEG